MNASAAELRSSLILLDKDLPKQGEVIGEKYRVEGTLGHGGMSAVFKVSHCVTKKSFALKWMLPSLNCEPDAVQRFIREAEVAGRFDHPNVVEVYDFGRQGDSLYMVMEFLHGENLATRLSAGPLSAEQACAILLPTARGVAAAHAAGVIHRDLKPQNIFLTSSPEGELVPKVLDFGISKMTQLPGELKPAITAEGTVIGTPHYMAPEQICGQPVDERIDVYALGVILYEALTGEVPFPCNSYGDLILRITTENPKPIRSLAPATPLVLVDIVARAMHRDRAFRFSSVTQLANALEQLAASFGYTSALPFTPTEPRIATPWPRTPMSSESRPVTAVRNRAMRLTALRKHGIELAGALILLAVFFALYNRPSVDSPSAPAASPSPAAQPKTLEIAKPTTTPTPAPQNADAAIELERSVVAPAPGSDESVARAEPAVAERPPLKPQLTGARRVTPSPRQLPMATRPAIAPAPGPPPHADQPVTSAPRPSTRRTHGLSQADF